MNVAQTQITEALQELRAARLDYDHSPNSDTALTMEYAELRLTRLLDRYCGCDKQMPAGQAMSGT